MSESENKDHWGDLISALGATPAPEEPSVPQRTEASLPRATSKPRPNLPARPQPTPKWDVLAEELGIAPQDVEVKPDEVSRVQTGKMAERAWDEPASPPRAETSSRETAPSRESFSDERPAAPSVVERLSASEPWPTSLFDVDLGAKERDVPAARGKSERVVDAEPPVPDHADAEAAEEREASFAAGSSRRSEEAEEGGDEGEESGDERRSSRRRRRRRKPRGGEETSAGAEDASRRRDVSPQAMREDLGDWTDEALSGASTIDESLVGESAEVDEAVEDSAEEAEGEGRRGRRRRPRRGRRDKGESEPRGASTEASRVARRANDDADDDAGDEGFDGDEDQLDAELRPGHKAIPTWDEAIGVLIEANIEARSRRPEQHRSRGYGSREGGRSGGGSHQRGDRGR